MKLLTKEIMKKIPMLYSESDKEGVELKDLVVQVKFFDPFGSWTWFVVEAAATVKSEHLAGKPNISADYVHNNPIVDITLKYVAEHDVPVEDVIFFGYVRGFEGEWGNFALSELESAKRIERDKYFTACKFGELKEYEV